MDIELNDPLLVGRADRFAALGEPARLAIMDALQVGDMSPKDLGDRLGLPSNLLTHHLRVLRAAGLILKRRSQGDRRKSYICRVPGVLEFLLPQAGPFTVQRVLFVGSGNALRSMLAESLWLEASSIPGASAGIEPLSQLRPELPELLNRHGLNPPLDAPQPLSEAIRPGDTVITVCDSAAEHLAADAFAHWSIPDPLLADASDAFEQAYGLLATYVHRLASQVSI
jgi:ArsR family transcriptional regulator, arsenate/arsenite/antimonite-responsive transcriptional repressor / arsenate reductase (thioredoxin)